MNFQNDLNAYIRAGYPLIYVSALEPERAISSIEKVCENINDGLSCHVWKNTTGWDNTGNGDDPDEIFECIDRRQTPHAVSILCNYHAYIGENPNPVLVQQFMDSYFKWKSNEDHRTVIVLSPFYKMAPELERFFQTINYTLPGTEQIEKIVDSIASGYEGIVSWDSDEHRDRVVANASGMTEDEIENSLALSIVKTKNTNDSPSIDPDLVMEEKAKILSKTGLLEYWPYPDALSSVGCLGNLKKWLLERKNAVFSEKAREFGLPNPKGLFLLGLPGTGKSLSAKCLSKEWGLPLIRFDLSKIFGSLVGESEEKMRMVLDQIESLAPAAVWIDEIEKGMAGAESSGTNDSGVTKRVFGQLLTWMEERPKDKMIYIVATANEATSLPSALLRRFDALFWVDLPTESDRKEILRIHLNKHNQLSKDIEKSMGRLCEVTRGFSGAEIENVVNSAMFKAFNDDSLKVSPAHIESASLEITPIAKLRREDIEVSRMWAKERCQFAQEEEPVNLDTLQQDRIRILQSRSINLN